MGLMSGIRNLFKRSDPVMVDLSGTQAQRLAAAVRSSAGEHDDAARFDEAGALMIEHKPTTVAAGSGGPRSLAELQRGYEEVMQVVRRVSDHLDSQSERTARITEVLERLPDVIDALPELNRHNTRLLDLLGDHLERTKTRDGAINAALARLTDNCGQQTEVLGLIQQQLDGNRQSSLRMADALGDFRTALADMNATGNRSVATLAQLAQSSGEREARLLLHLGVMRRWLVTAVVCLLLTLLAALAAAAWMAWRSGFVAA
jgi:hypothetical protein